MYNKVEECSHQLQTANLHVFKETVPQQVTVSFSYYWVYSYINYAFKPVGEVTIYIFTIVMLVIFMITDEQCHSLEKIFLGIP